MYVELSNGEETVSDAVGGHTECGCLTLCGGNRIYHVGSQTSTRLVVSVEFFFTVQLVRISTEWSLGAVHPKPLAVTQISNETVYEVRSISYCGRVPLGSGAVAPRCACVYTAK